MLSSNDLQLSHRLFAFCALLLALRRKDLDASRKCNLRERV